MAYRIYNYSYWGESKPTYILGASHCKYFMCYVGCRTSMVSAPEVVGISDHLTTSKEEA